MEIKKKTQKKIIKKFKFIFFFLKIMHYVGQKELKIVLKLTKTVINGHCI